MEDYAAWDQVVKVIRRKVNQFIDAASNILVIGSSSSHCIDDSIIPTVINIIAEEVSQNDKSEVAKLNGIMLISSDYNFSQRRSVYFFQTHQARVPFNQATLESLHSIRRG